ncbi:RNA polymerase sigma factor [Paenibacillus allorhizosphaerae]|uniref:RNA polymerase sigma factor n=1 Tax=Paenibacillus allorhizosphaerae TaxID=2849866 RepID=A0ABN7U048_9BACL|nr:sigma-70 family RNA polymerase sigma factor [Paenibacillus allorhizosphaerae]CAG7658497.1 hypothetical protein PAECIP111802_07057 [Paenibacillus allorhizosphaerae]
MDNDNIVSSLVKQARSGSREAFDELVLLHRRRVMGIARAIVSDSSTAEDIVQETFLQTFMHLRSLNDPEKFVPWLDRIVRNQSFMRLRKEKNRRRFVALHGKPNGTHEDEGDWIAHDSDYTRGLTYDLDPAELHERQELLRQTASLLSVLTNRERIVFTEHIFGHKSAAEISENMRIKPSNVYNLLSRAKTKLKQETLQQELEPYLSERRAAGKPVSILLPGQPLRWDRGCYHSFLSITCEMLHLIPNGRTYSLTDISGLTGHAFRLCISPDLGPSGFTGFDWPSMVKSSWRNLGFTVKTEGRPGSVVPDVETAANAIRLVQQSLEHGYPSMGWNLSAAEFGMIYGYDDDVRQLTVADISGPNRRLAYAELCTLNGSPELFAAVVTGPDPDMRAPDGKLLLGKAVVQSLSAAVAHMRGEEKETRGYVSGLRAYDAWIEAFRTGAFINKLDHAMNVLLVLEARHHAARFLDKLQADFISKFGKSGASEWLQPLQAAQAYYERSEHCWHALARRFSYPDCGNPFDPGEAAAAIRLLEQAKDAEMHAAAALEGWVQRFSEGIIGLEYERAPKFFT